jgi:ribonucleoside-diphosphate reductase alpha chain
MKYAKYISELQRRETWEELVTRNMNMHINKFPNLEAEIMEAYQYVLDKQVLPSMRSFQFGGKPIELSPNRLYNCSYCACDDVAIFSEMMFLLLGGSGVGYSVQQHHIAKLPEITGPKKRLRRYLISDSIEG